MTKDEITTLLDSRDIHFRRAAINDIVTSFPMHADLFFAAFQTDGQSSEEMADAAIQWMPFLRAGYTESLPPFETSRQYTSFHDMAECYSVFVSEMNKYIESLDDDSARKTKNILRQYFHGLEADLASITAPTKPEEHRQLMVFVTGRCNLHCPYCFSKELYKSSISKIDMTRVMSWAQRWKVQSILPCGGEPLLYEHINWLIQEVEQRGMKMYFATNLTVQLPDAMLNGECKCIEQLHVHLTDELFHNDRMISMFLNNLRLCCEKGIDIILRGNICEGNEQHYDDWFRIAKEYNIDALNIAFTIPSHTGSNRFVHFENIRTMVPHLRYIWELGKKNNICISIAKPVPLCLLPEDLALEILRHHDHAAYCNISEDGGMHNLSLSNDMRFSPCLGVDEPSVMFDDNLKWEDLRNIFGRAVCESQSHPLFKHCTSCFLYDRKLCQGACLSYKQVSRNGGSLCGK